jgi:hypothetical protein
LNGRAYFQPIEALAMRRADTADTYAMHIAIKPRESRKAGPPHGFKFRYFRRKRSFGYRAEPESN